MRTIISNRLYSLLPFRTELKINQQNYFIKLTFGGSHEDNYNNIVIDYDMPELNYFCYNKSNKITCWQLSKGDQPVNDSGQWKKEGRQEIKPGKFLMLFKDKFIVLKVLDYEGYNREEVNNNDERDKVILRLCELFTEKIKGCNDILTFDESNNISEIYNTDEAEGSGYLQSSCMRVGSSYGCQSYSEFYNLVPDLKVIYKKVNERLYFRALYWHNCQDSEGNNISFIDRIYGNEQTNQQIANYCENNNIGFRPFNDNRIILNGKNINVKKELSNEAIDYLMNTGRPFVDTLFKFNGKYLSNYINSEYSLQECDGSPLDNCDHCSICGGSIPEGEGTYFNDELYCDDCRSEYLYCCDNCGEWLHRDNDDYINTDNAIYCEHCAEKLGINLCEHCGEYHKNCYYIDGEGYFCESCFCDNFFYCEHCDQDKRINEANDITLDGNHELICNDCLNDFNKCDECDNYFSDPLNEHDDKNYCDDCFAEIEETINI